MPLPARLWTASDRSRPAFAWVTALLLALPALAWSQTSSPRPSPTPPGLQSLQVYVDVRTLALDLTPGNGRVPLTLGPEVLEKLDMTTTGLTPTTANGVTRMDLKGRFQPVWVAVVGADGKARPFCLTSLPPQVDAAARTVRARNREVTRGR
jgi:hypothetical protein